MLTALRHTFVTNVIQQICAALIILYLPNILGKGDYAQVVYVTVLLSFFAFSDAGMSMAYSRVVPALLAQDKHAEIGLWNSTTRAFGLLASAVYSVLIAFLYYVRYGHPLNAMLLLPMPFVVFWFSFYSTRANAHGDFRLYWRVNSARSIASLTVFPLAFLCGLTGWFAAMLAAVFFALASLGKRLFEPLGRPHWPLIRRHLGEGLTLSSTAVLRMQLFYFARLYASMRYGADDIASYGIMTAAYQSLSTLIISVFLPVSVEVQRHYGVSEEKALAFANRTIARSLPLVMTATLLSIACAPPLFRLCFPRYHFDSTLLMTMLLGTVFYPFFLVYGPLMVAYKRFGQFLAAVIACLGSGWLFSMLADRHHYSYGAAWGQLFGLICYTLVLFVMIYYDVNKRARHAWRPQACYLAATFALCVALIGLYSK